MLDAIKSYFDDLEKPKKIDDDISKEIDRLEKNLKDLVDWDAKIKLLKEISRKINKKMKDQQYDA